MKIKAVWPNCNRHNGKWTHTFMDSFWVECTLDEVEKKIMEFIKPDCLERFKKNLHEIKSYFSSDRQHDRISYQQNIVQRYCRRDLPILYFLVSKDLESVELSNWSYPISQHWNGYSPFVFVNEIDIADLDDLQYLNEYLK